MAQVDAGTEILFSVRGFVRSIEGAKAHLILIVNDQATLFTFRKQIQIMRTQGLNYKAGTESGLRFTIVLIADRDSKSTATAELDVLSIDGTLDPLQRTTSALKRKP